MRNLEIGEVRGLCMFMRKEHFQNMSKSKVGNKGQESSLYFFLSSVLGCLLTRHLLEIVFE